MSLKIVIRSTEVSKYYFQLLIWKYTDVCGEIKFVELLTNKIRQRKEKDGLCLSIAESKIQWDSNPRWPYGY